MRRRIFIRYREKGIDAAWADVGSVKFQPGIFRDRGPDAAAAVVHGNRSGGDQCSCLDTSACAGEAAVSVQARQLQAAACGGDGVGGCGYLAQSCGPEAVDRFKLPETVTSPVSIWPLALLMIHW